MGFDAIQLGGTLAWIMELVAEELIPPEEFGLPPRSEMAFTFTADVSQFDLVVDSRRNAECAVAIVDGAAARRAAAVTVLAGRGRR